MAVAPRRRQAVPMTKLGELMFQQTYTLDRLLARPVRPPSYGLKRPVTYAKQRTTAAEGAAGSPAGLVEQTYDNDASAAQRSDMQARLAPTTLPEASPLLSRLEALPPELVDAVLAAIVSHSDLFALGCALPRLWPYVSRHVEEVYLKRKLGVWAGTAIAIVSQETPSDPGPQDPERNYPAGLLTADDAAEIRRGIGANEVKEWGRTPGVHPAFAPVGLYDLADARYRQPYIERGYCDYHYPGLVERLRRAPQLHSLLLQFDAAEKEAATDDSSAGHGPGAVDGSRVDRRLGFCDQLAVMLAHVQHIDSAADFYPAERGPYILRNLTTKQFVRAAALARPSAAASTGAEAVQQRSGPFLKGITFGDAVAAHILWQEGARALPRGLQDMRGVECWAGHRFDITTVDRHERQEGRAGRLAEWSDISGKIGREMKSLWPSHRGEYT